MEDYKKRMQEEYNQLVERVIKLENMITKARNNELEFELVHPLEQLQVMKRYMELLEERALIKDVELSFDVKGE